ncbi:MULTISPECIES: DUF6264 family protein [unclassified Mycobacterium]|uniref:DUF6264 family protein n=1 Tax=unclassified Mycobacterium TaxID=2642494 RepID=UPI001E34524F|nr:MULTISPECIES: DUF6264 family protein [unclassified Mycobacterium]
MPSGSRSAPTAAWWPRPATARSTASRPSRGGHTGPMPTDDDEMQAAINAYSQKGQRNPTADRIATVLLLATQAFLVAVTVGLLGLFVMGTDPCGTQKCGDPAWIDRAMVLGIGGGVVLVVIALVVAIRRLAKRRTAFFVPLLGCVAQVALAVGAAAMETLAGPV